MRIAYLAGFLGLAIVFATACGGPTVPISAQAGSTIVIPVTGELLAGSDTIVGFGNEFAEDRQRGILVFRLREAGKELHTRLTTSVTTTGIVSANLVRDSNMRQVVSLVDLPADSPVGTFHIDVARRFRDLEGVEREESIPYGGEVTVLPHQLDLDCDQTADVIGRPTPWVAFFPQAGGGVTPVEIATSGGSGNVIAGMTPLPELVIRLLPAPSALELEVAYPADKIRVEGVMDESRSKLSREIVWWDEPAPGQLSIGRIGLGGDHVSIAFSLTTAEPLDLAEVSVTIRSATDANGFEVPTTVASTFIR